MAEANIGQKRQITNTFMSVKSALQALTSPETSPNSKRQGWLKALGDGRFDVNSRNKQQKVTTLHTQLAVHFRKQGPNVTQNDIMNHLLEESSEGKLMYRLEDLLAHGTYGLTILHTILDLNTYWTSKTDATAEYDLNRLKPFITFLIQLQPNLPAVMNKEFGGGPPLFAVLNAGSQADEDDPVLDRNRKEEIIRFFCDKHDEKKNPGGLESAAAVKSLAMMVSLPRDNSESHWTCHAVHVAIKHGIQFSPELLESLRHVTVTAERSGRERRVKQQVSCPMVRDSDGWTCLHLALTRPFSKAKVWWAQRLAELEHRLLEARAPSSSNSAIEGILPKTPLQHFTEQLSQEEESHRKDMDNEATGELQSNPQDLKYLKDALMRQCLSNFDPDTCKDIMYTRENARELCYTLEDDTVTWTFLEEQNRHYRLDTSLKSVHISQSVSIQWDEDSNDIRKKASTWRCAGSTDFYMIFAWLKNKRKVNKVVEVFADDFATSERKAHSDQAIVECLKDLHIEIWEWKRMDIPAEVIIDACGDDVTTLYLFCSGLKAVLQSWADRRGLVNLSKLNKVYVEIHQGLESASTIKRYIEDFKTDLSELYFERWGRRIEIGYRQLQGSLSPGPGGEFGPSKIKNENEPGFKEQDWLKCMDEFADFMEYLDNEPSKRPIKVALIDDGVKTSYAQLNRNVHSGWQQPRPKPDEAGKVPRIPYRNYNSSQTGHGTVMAYYIRRVCPNVQLHVAKLQPAPQQGDNAGQDNKQITFSMDSASEAIEWAVREGVHIICMSWAIENSEKNLSKEQRLRKAITSAADEDILLFCANPDKGEGHPENRTYPLRLDRERIFCIGAANQDGNPWARIDSRDISCNYYFPGVDLGIQVVSTAKKTRGEPPDEWHKHSGSSLACALATGLAAMILHCTLVSGISPGDSKWADLKTPDGMNKAFKAITVDQASSSKWLPVRRVFGTVIEFLGSTTDTQKRKLRDNVVAEFIPRSPWVDPPLGRAG